MSWMGEAGLEPLSAGSLPMSREPADAARRFLLRREQTVPTPLLPPPVTEAGLVLALSILADLVEALSQGTLRIHRLGLPAPVQIHLPGLSWSCEAGWASGTGLVELAAWLADQDLVSMACMLGLVLARQGRR
ncbi:hypothetical protein [Teichococcus aestuarii]|uniref:Uncharacterized protein n=1 Tax=Teichococcus aestuarii TaxID=568898 RepID=A0A2U1UZ78_9PROT|nr:hypothetical protein [Pseudoroseomonas aestuarii]PWC26963.1 hypothetical protein CR165_20560 [Pseudoroseomonas aestuarii]